jgi:hypothetical protein
MATMDLQKIHNHILLRINKELSGYVTHGEIDQALDYAQMVYFNRLFGSPNTYQPGRTVATPGYGVTQKVHDDLAPFKKVVLFNNESLSALNNYGTAPNGVAVLPSDYIHMIALYVGTSAYSTVTTLAFDSGSQNFTPPIIAGTLYKIIIKNEDGNPYDGNINATYNGATLADGTVSEVIFYASASQATLAVTADPGGTITLQKLSYPATWSLVDFLSEDQWANRISSKLLSPVASEPICKMLTKGGELEGIAADGSVTVLTFADNVFVQLWPRIGYHLECVYLRRPATPNYVFTTSGRTETYNAGASTQLEWNDQALTVIMELAINILAENLQDQSLAQHTETKNQQPR